MTAVNIPPLVSSSLGWTNPAPSAFSCTLRGPRPSHFGGLSPGSL